VEAFSVCNEVDASGVVHGKVLSVLGSKVAYWKRLVTAVEKKLMWFYAVSSS
jgi:hypothetical protein